MCNQLSNNNPEGEEKRMLSTLRKNWLLILLLSMLVGALLIASPFFEETQISIEISGDVIGDVSVNTKRVSTISKIVKRELAHGAYTINITIVEIGKNFTIENVPSGEYTIVWQSGVPSSGRYTIKVELIRDGQRDEFTLYVTF